MGQSLAVTETILATASAPAAERGAAPTPGGISQAGADRASHIGLALLAALNVIDLVLTRRFLSLGLAEGNPLMAVAVRSWQAAACKVAILGALAWSFSRRPATATRLVLVWTAVGLYLLGAYVNLGAIRSAEAILH